MPHRVPSYCEQVKTCGTCGLVRCLETERIPITGSIIKD